MGINTPVTQMHTTVPFLYRVNMSWSGRISPESGKQINHSMSMRGEIHPDPYNHDAAVVLLRAHLAPYLAMGWCIDSMVVNAYDRKDA